MLARVLRRFQDFSQRDWRDLNTIAEHTQILNLPANRPLVRSGRRLSGSYFLLRGTLRVGEPDLVVRHGHPRARHSVYPGFETISTLTPVQMLHVDTRPIGFLLGDMDDLGDQSFETCEQSWEDRFLNTCVMQRLAPAAWQQILKSMREITLPSGADVIREGDPQDGFYVIKTGRAQVHRSGQTLGLLQTGVFFGEDALIADKQRNATVTMLQEGSVMRLPRSLFLDLVLRQTLNRTAQMNDRIWVSVTGRAEALHVKCSELREQLIGLDAQAPYLVVDGDWSARALVAFVMTQRGFDVHVLDPAVAI